MAAQGENAVPDAVGPVTLPVVWLLGASGVGKSTSGYRLLSALADAGVTAAFVDADQLRLASGIGASETGLIASSLPALDRGFRDNGAELLVVGGLADDAEHLSALLPGVPRDRVLAVCLEADADSIRERVRQRGWLLELTEDAVAYAHAMRPDFADVRIDTTCRPPKDVVASIAGAALAHLTRLEPATVPLGAEPSPTAPNTVITIAGPGGAGISTVGYQTFSRLAGRGAAVAYLDIHQLGFLGRDGGSRGHVSMSARNAVAVTSCLAGAGAQTVVLSGDPASIRLLERSWGRDVVAKTFWLHASPAALAERIGMRARGEGPPLQGIHRRGLSGPALDDSIAAAIAESESIDLRPERAHVIDTSRLTAGEVADAMLACFTTR